MYVVCLKEKFRYTMDTQGKYHVNKKVMIKVMLLHFRGSLRLPVNHQNSGEKFETDFCSHPTEAILLA